MSISELFSGEVWFEICTAEKTGETSQEKVVRIYLAWNVTSSSLFDGAPVEGQPCGSSWEGTPESHKSFVTLIFL